MKKVWILWMTFLLLSWSYSALAEKVEGVWENYAQEVEILSEDSVELHIGLIFEGAANNPMLEQAFFLKYPQGKIIYHFYSLDQLNAYLLSGDDELDMLLISDSMRQTFAKQGLLKNLYETNLFSQWPDSWIDLRQQLETSDGKLYGFPRSVEVGYMSWYDALGAQVNVEKPDALWSWDDFTHMATDLCYDIDGDGVHDFCLLSGMFFNDGMKGFNSTPLEVFTYQCVLTGETYSSSAFSLLLKQFIQVYETQSLNPEGISLFQENPAQLIMDITESGAEFWVPEGYSYLNYPTLYEDSPAYLGRSYVFTLLNNAPNPNVALDFLRTSLELCNLQIYDSIITYMNRTMPSAQISCWNNSATIGFVPSRNGELVYICQRGDYILQDVSNFTDITEQQFMDYNFMRTHFLPITGQWYSVSSLLYEMLPQYFNGSISLDQITTAMDQRMHMMQNE